MRPDETNKALNGDIADKIVNNGDSETHETIDNITFPSKHEQSVADVSEFLLPYFFRMTIHSTPEILSAKTVDLSSSQALDLIPQGDFFMLEQNPANDENNTLAAQEHDSSSKTEYLKNLTKKLKRLK